MEVPDSVKTNNDDLASITHDLAKVVDEVCGQINQLKEEREGTTGDVAKAYTAVIANKVWILQTLIGAYWRKTLDLTFDDSDFAETARRESGVSNAGR